ncbi:MAG: CHASE2 domain-containing protein [Rivularia sp. (in: cyanobacteria)]
MLERIKRTIKNEIPIWRIAAIPGIILIIVVVIARLSGSLQFLEWMLLDTFLRMRPDQPVNEKVVIVGINEDDIQKIGRYPIPDGEIAELINKIQAYKPRVIGLDIFKNVPIEPGSEELRQVFQENQDIIGIEKVLKPNQISAPQYLDKKQVGFVDIIPDKDGRYRRSLLWTPNPDNPENVEEDKFSFPLRLATGYLSAENISLDLSDQSFVDSETIQLGSSKIPIFDSNTGGYVNTDDGGIQILVNFHNGTKRFLVVSLDDIKNNKIQRNLLQNKVVIIGMVTATIPDFFNTSAIKGLKLNGQIYGVEYHAHATSQIINAVMNKRPLLTSWSDNWEYLWIVIWGFFPIVIGRLTQSVWQNLFAVGVSSVFLIAGGYLFLMWWGWWIPVAPGLLILVINGVGLSAFAFYQHDKALKSQIKERKDSIEYTFTVIHNGPLQTLANTLSNLRTQELSQDKLIMKLEKLNTEIRDIGDFLKQETLNSNDILRLGSGLVLDLKKPANELFYEVYTSTVQRNDLNYLNDIKAKTRSFEPIDDSFLSLEEKRGLCQFIEESLCNVGKHAQGAKRIQVTGKTSDGWYTLSVKDNGSGLKSFTENKGTKQCKDLAFKLGGNFKRQSISPKGCLSEITWCLVDRKNFLQKIQSQLQTLLQRF